MRETEFIEELKKRAKEQEAIIKGMPFPKVFEAVSIWLGVHPWRFVIPFSLMVTLMLRLVLGPSYTDFVLSVFRIPILRLLL